MVISREQFNELGKFYIDDFPISGNQDFMFELFNSLPKNLKGLAIQWGLSDTVFRDDVFELLCKNQLNMTCEEYYNSKIAKDYFDNGVLIEFCFNKLRNPDICIQTGISCGFPCYGGCPIYLEDN